MGARNYWTQAEESELTVRWIGGETVYAIAAVMGKGKSNISQKAYRMGLPPRLKKDRGCAQIVYQRVIRRCEDCYGHYASTLNDFSGHGEACPRARKQAA